MKEVAWKTGYWDFSWEELHAQEHSEEGNCAFLPQEGAELEIPFGDLSETPKLEKTGMYFSGLERGRYDYLFGMTQDGVRLVLCDVLSMGVGSSCPGGTYERLKASTVLEARHEFDPNSPVAEMDIEIDGMRDWLDVRYELIHEKRSILIDLENSEKVIPVIASSSLEITLRVGIAKVRSSRQGVEAPLHCYFRISFTGGKDLDSVWAGEVWRLQSMLAFCFGRCPSILWAKVRFADDDRRVSVHRSSAFLDSTRRFPALPPVPFHQLKEEGLAAFVDNWMALEGDQWNAARTLASLLGEWNMPLNLKLLAATTMLESLARSVTNDPFSQDELKPLVEPMISVADESIRDRARGLLNLLHSPSYGMLLDSVFARCGIWGERLIPNWVRFKNEQHDIRNSVAHGKDAGEERQVMANHYYAQIVLAYFVLIQMLGLPTEALDGFEKSGFLNVVRARITKEYSKRDERIVS